MADEDADNDVKLALDAVQVVQSMIDVSADRLEGLRTQCATSAELTQQEIRTLEGKLIKLFSRQLVTKAKLIGTDFPPEFENIPCLTQWLKVVGLSPESIEMVVRSVPSLEALQDRADRELRAMLNTAPPHDVRRLTRAMHNLKKYMETLLQSGSVTPGSAPSSEIEMSLYWDSWERRGSPRAPRTVRAARAAPPPSEIITPSPPPPPPSSPHPARSKGNKFPTTPPPRRRLQTSLAPPPSTNPSPDSAHTTLTPISTTSSHSALTKSRSHESQLSVNMTGEEEHSERGSRTRLCGGNGEVVSVASPSALQSPPPHIGISTGFVHSSATPVHSNDEPNCKGNAGVPRSPRTPTVARGMGHYIAHRFTKTFKMIATCDYCDKQMLFGAGLKCKECKYKCHRDCETKVPPSCGLPPEFVDEFRRKLQSDGSVFLVNHSPSSGRSPQHSLMGGGAVGSAANLLSSFTHRARKRSHPHQLNANAPSYPGGPDSSSNTSSCNSSTPSSPALLGAPIGTAMLSLGGVVTTGAPPTAPQTPRTPLATHIKQHFHFPEIKKVSSVSSVGNHHPHYVHHTPLHQQTHHHHTTPNTPHHQHHTTTVNDSAKSGGDSSRTVSLSGSASTDEDRTPARADSTDGDAGGTGGSSSQGSGNAGGGENTTGNSHWPRQNSLSMKEWDIPYDELRVADVLGTGRFGTVYHGYWHGDVAVKLLNVQYLQADDTALDNFKQEVATFRKTRHENLVLFMGACMKPPRLAIVTSLCKGMTLYTHIHLRRDKFNMNKTTIVAQQISQGMGYLHARGIVHKDLKSKNIFLENGKVIITDFGLFSVTKLCYGNSGRGDSLGIPAGWLCYLAPELVRALRPHADLPFSTSSDVYAFGTVWYELLCGEWPFKGQPPEAVIWQVGKGMKQTLTNLQVSRDVKDILMLCWSFRMSERPDFPSLLSTLERLPRKRLARSPSHPVHLSRSAESVF